IHDQGYRRYTGHRRPGGMAWAVIAKAGIRSMLAKRVFVGLLLLAWLPFFGRAIAMYFSATIPPTPFTVTTAETFHSFLEQQGLFVFFVTVYAGAGLIANDRRANAMQIYLSKPLTRLEYVFGKLSILVAFLLLVTWVAAILLLFVQIMFAGNTTFLRGNLFLFPAITVFSVIAVLTVSVVLLRLSAVWKSGRYVGILYTGLFFFTSALFGVVTFSTGAYRTTPGQGRPGVSWISPSADLTQIGQAIFRLPPRYDSPWTVSV